MERYGIEWEHKGTHEKHLSVLDYKKQEREKEVAVLGAKIEQKQVELESLSNRVLNYDKAKDELSNLEFELDTAPKYQLCLLMELYHLSLVVREKSERTLFRRTL